MLDDLADQRLELIELGRPAALRITELGGATRLAGLEQVHHQEVLLLLREPAPLSLGHQLRSLLPIPLLELLLSRRERCVASLLGEGRQLRENLLFSTPQHHGRDPLAQARQVLVPGNLSRFGLLVKLEVELPEWPEHVGIDDLHQRVQVIEPVFNGRTRQDERKARRDLLNRPRRLGAEVLRALRLVVDDDVGVELLQLTELTPGELVVQNLVRRIRPERMTTADGAPTHHDRAHSGEPLDLTSPLVLQRRQRDHDHARRFAACAQQLTRGDGLSRLTEPHVVSQDGPTRAEQVRRAFPLVRKERHRQHVEPERPRSQRSDDGSTPTLDPSCSPQTLGQHDGRVSNARFSALGHGQRIPRRGRRRRNHQLGLARYSSKTPLPQSIVVPATERPKRRRAYGAHGQDRTARNLRQLAKGARQNRHASDPPPNRLQVLAGPELVRQEVGARAGVVLTAAIDDVDVISAAAGARNAISPVDTFIEGNHSKSLRIRAVLARGPFEPPHLALILVRLTVWGIMLRRQHANSLHVRRPCRGGCDAASAARTTRRAPVLQPGQRAGNAWKSHALAQLPVHSKNQSDFGVSSGT